MNFTSKASLGLALLGICALGFSHPASAQTIFSDNFESPSIGTGTNGLGYQTYNNGDTFNGWTVTSGNVNLTTSQGGLSEYHWDDHGGINEFQSLDLNGSEPGSVSRTISGFEVGQQYNLSFWLAGNPYAPQGSKSLSVTLGIDANPLSNILTSNTLVFNTTNRNSSYDPNNPQPNDMGWSLQTFTFNATSSSLVLGFSGITPNDGNGAAIDDVLISGTAVTPEAGGLMNLAGALLAPGLGMIAIRRRARRKDAALAA